MFNEDIYLPFTTYGNKSQMERRKNRLPVLVVMPIDTMFYKYLPKQKMKPN